ncbi:sugar ABC transporter substrate-binding protein [Fredinandcohnia sp. QZ13]|uniref:ABC transporter substrate-binding protein n=1 Tax=Fredinandcohnia sp. QZ13 TaxID=3073144 RepID=UPI002853137B|nr:sugar ABC transporter substrate-binding protein [Fredinandcohnia sp. QZ13]MDR4889964.1 sugar ABC transporter substrate-binding protein [Fredinandcohnia sp. QZ13]
MKNKFSFFIVGIGLAILLTACGSSGGQSAADDEVITIWANNINVPVLEKAAEIYKKDHPDFKVDIIETGGQDIKSKTTTGLQAGGKGLPDGMLQTDDELQGKLEAFPGAFANLSELGYDEFKNDFPDFKLEAGSKDGNIYAMPFDTGPAAVFYRTDIFAEAGVNPDDIKTWDDFVEAGGKVKEATGKAMLSFDQADANQYTIMLNQQGEGYFDENNNLTVGSEASVNALEVLKGLHEKDALLGVTGWDAWVTSIANSDTASVIAGGWLVGTIKQQALDTEGNWGLMPLPAHEEGGSRSSVQGGSSFVIPSTGNQVQETYDFLSWFTTSVKAQEIAMEGGLFPTYAPVFESEMFDAEEPFFGNQKIWRFLADEMDKIPTIIYTKNDPIARDEIVKAQGEALNGKSPDEAMQQAKKNIENRMK